MNNEQLRDIMTANYEDVRAAFARIRDGDLARETALGVPVSRLVAAIVISVRHDIRAAERVAAGLRATPQPISRGFAAISDWRATRAFATADRAGILAVWENAFNDLFSCVNDLSAEPLDLEDPAATDRVAEACAYLRSGLDRWPLRAAELRQAIDAPRSAG